MTGSLEGSIGDQREQLHQKLGQQQQNEQSGSTASEAVAEVTMSEKCSSKSSGGVDNQKQEGANATANGSSSKKGQDESTKPTTMDELLMAQHQMTERLRQHAASGGAFPEEFAHLAAALSDSEGDENTGRQPESSSSKSGNSHSQNASQSAGLDRDHSTEGLDPNQAALIQQILAAGADPETILAHMGFDVDEYDPDDLSPESRELGIPPDQETWAARLALLQQQVHDAKQQAKYQEIYGKSFVTQTPDKLSVEERLTAATQFGFMYDCFYQTVLLKPPGSVAWMKSNDKSTPYSLCIGGLQDTRKGGSSDDEGGENSSTRVSIMEVNPAPGFFKLDHGVSAKNTKKRNDLLPLRFPDDPITEYTTFGLGVKPFKVRVPLENQTSNGDGKSSGPSATSADPSSSSVAGSSSGSKAGEKFVEKETVWTGRRIWTSIGDVNRLILVDQLMVAVGQAGLLKVYDMSDNAVPPRFHPLEHHTGECYGLGGCGNYIFSGAEDGKVAKWDLTKLKEDFTSRPDCFMGSVTVTCPDTGTTALINDLCVLDENIAYGCSEEVPVFRVKDTGRKTADGKAELISQAVVTASDYARWLLSTGPEKPRESTQFLTIDIFENLVLCGAADGTIVILDMNEVESSAKNTDSSVEAQKKIDSVKSGLFPPLSYWPLHEGMVERVHWRKAGPGDRIYGSCGKSDGTVNLCKIGYQQEVEQEERDNPDDSKSDSGSDIAPNDVFITHRGHRGGVTDFSFCPLPSSSSLSSSSSLNNYKDSEPTTENLNIPGVANNLDILVASVGAQNEIQMWRPHKSLLGDSRCAQPPSDFVQGIISDIFQNPTEGLTLPGAGMGAGGLAGMLGGAMGGLQQLQAMQGLQGRNGKETLPSLQEDDEEMDGPRAMDSNSVNGVDLASLGLSADELALNGMLDQMDLAQLDSALLAAESNAAQSNAAQAQRKDPDQTPASLLPSGKNSNADSDSGILSGLPSLVSSKESKSSPRKSPKKVDSKSSSSFSLSSSKPNSKNNSPENLGGGLNTMLSAMTGKPQFASSQAQSSKPYIPKGKESVGSNASLGAGLMDSIFGDRSILSLEANSMLDDQEAPTEEDKEAIAAITRHKNEAIQRLTNPESITELQEKDEELEAESELVGAKRRRKQ